MILDKFHVLAYFGIFFSNEIIAYYFFGRNKLFYGLSLSGPSSSVITMEQNQHDCVFAGFFPDPYDCSIYHWCAMGKDKIIACQPGLFYDVKRGTCDWPAKVSCEYNS